MDYLIESIQNKTIDEVDIEKIYKKNKKRLEEKVIKSIQDGIGTESDNFEDFFDRILTPEFENVYFIHNHNRLNHKKQNLVQEMACNLRYHMLKEGLIKEVETGENTWRYELGKNLKKEEEIIMEKGYEIKGWDGKSTLHLEDLNENDYVKIFFENIRDINQSNALTVEDNNMYEMGLVNKNEPELLKETIERTIKSINETLNDIKVENGLVAKEPFEIQYFDEEMTPQLKKLYPTKVPGIFVSKTLASNVMEGEYIYGVDTVNGKELEKYVKREKTITTANLSPDEPEGNVKGNNLYK